MTLKKLSEREAHLSLMYVLHCVRKMLEFGCNESKLRGKVGGKEKRHVWE